MSAKLKILIEMSEDKIKKISPKVEQKYRKTGDKR